MPLFLSCSNRVEELHTQLARLLKLAPLKDPLQEEVIVVPGMAMQRWVNQQLALQHGIAANIHYPLPAAWIWSLAARTNPNELIEGEDPLSRENAAWRIYALLPGLLERAEFQELQRYLHNDESGVKRWQLAQRLADIFDRYQYYRPDWIRDWSTGKHNAQAKSANVPLWQVALWQGLVQECPNSHRVALIDNLLQVLNDPVARDTLLKFVPERISCFALSSLPPLFVQVLHALAQYTDIFLFLHSPTDQYWADLRSQKDQARLRLEKPAEAVYYDTGNELLASWGRQGQAFQDLLLNDDSIESTHWEDYLQAGGDSLLHRLQDDILALTNTSQEVPLDESVEISVCHSPMRECQVLHDRLLAAIDADPTLKPEDILVMVPEISRYAPYVEAVFRQDEHSDRPFIPWNLSDINVADEHPLVRIFLQLLTLSSSRFSFSELASYLEVPQIAAQFELEGSTQDELLALLRESEVRWGINAAHKQALDLPKIEQNTWEHGIDRLIAGYAMSDIALWHNIAPMNGVGGASAAALGRFCGLLETLKQWHLTLNQSRSAQQWQQLLNAMLETLFGTQRDDDDRLQQIRDAIDELASQAGEQILSIELLRLCLEESLSTRTQHNRFFSGGVSICGMRPMRSLPFRMICVLGLNDAAFPRTEQNQSFDAMGKHWQAGDPRKGDEDRYLLLETLLCARDKLYVSYTGRSLKDNSELQASVLLREFMDFLNAHYIPEGSDDANISEKLTFEYPMQAFSWRQFEALAGDSARQSYDSWWCDVAQTLQSEQRAPDRLEAWPITAIPMPEESVEQVELSRLIRFMQHPVKGFFNLRLGIYLHDGDASDDEENFAIDGLSTWQMHKGLISTLLKNEAQPSNELLALYQAQGILPHGAMAQNAYDTMREKASDLLERLQAYESLDVEPLAIELACQLPNSDEVVAVTAHLTQFYPSKGLLHYTPSSMKPKHLLALWLEHLAFCAASARDESLKSVLICKDQEVQFSMTEPAMALSQLTGYVSIYREGLTRPLPLFPLSSFELGLGDDESAIKKARGKWNSSEYSYAADEDDPYINLVNRHCATDPLAEQEHLDLAYQVYATLRHAQEQP